MKEQPIKIGYIYNGHRGRGNPISDPVYVEIRKTKTGFNLSGNIRSHSYGQIDETIRKAIKEGKFEYIIPKHEVKRLLQFWETWHLNDMKPGCWHQEDEKEILKKTRPEIFKNYDYLKIKSTLSNNGYCHICNNEYGHSWKIELPPPKELKWIREFKQKYEGMKLGRRIKL